MNVEKLFLDQGALLKGHFQLSSGLHSDRYLQCALVLADTPSAEALGQGLSAMMRPAPDVVVSPAMGGLIIGHEVARAYSVKHFFTERVDGVVSLRRGFALQPKQRVIVVEDVVTTGKSTREVFAVIRAAGAVVQGVLSIVDRSEGKAKFEVPHAALWTVTVPAWLPPVCPLCKTGAPAVKPGSRKEPKNA